MRKLTGVVGINNFLVVRPKTSAAEIKAQVEAAFSRNAQLKARQIRVSVEGNRVKLEGHVHFWVERKAAENAAWAMPGVSRVDNHPHRLKPGSS